MIHGSVFTSKALFRKTVNSSTSNTYDAFLQTTLDKISWDTSPFFPSVLAYLCDTPCPPINVDCYVLLVADKFSKCNFYFNIDWGKGGGGAMTKFVFLG